MKLKLNTRFRKWIGELESCEVKDVDRIVRIADCTYSPERGELSLRCALSSGGTVPVVFNACRPGIFRLCMGFEDGCGAEDDSIFSKTRWEPIATEFAEDADAYYLIAFGRRAAFSKSAWRYTITDADGKTVFETQDADKDCEGLYECSPLGYCSLHGRSEVYSSEAIKLCADEDIYGFGERFEEVSKRGKVEVTLVNGPLGTVPKICYKPVPFYFSTRGYGLLLNSSKLSTFDLGARSYHSVSIVCPGKQLDYYIFAAPTPADALKCYCEVTGYPGVPPIWALGYNQASAEIRRGDDGKEHCGYNDQETVLSVAREMRQRGIPCDSITLDCAWSAKMDLSDFNYKFNPRFPDPAGMIGNLKELGYHVMLWQWPYMKESYPDFKEATERGFLVKDKDGDLALAHEDGMYCIDFSNPEAAAWVSEKNSRLLELGIEGFMTDFGELAPMDGVYHNGMTGETARNIFPLLYQRSVYDTVTEKNGECVLWARSGFTSMQRTPGHWAGDNSSTFESLGAVIRAGINAGLSGIPFWGHDIAGWFGEKLDGKFAWKPASKELFVRWAQFGFFSPMLRSHGTRACEPWGLGDEAEAAFKKYGLLRVKLMPYIESLAEEAGRTGMPIIRAMILEFPDDLACRRLDQQYMFGPDILVAPVCNPDGYVQVYLPAGRWKDFWTGEAITGPSTQSLRLPLEKMPLYVREGSSLFDVVDTYRRDIFEV